MTTALIMAGGRGERMRASGASTPKPLLRIGGVSLLEHNLFAVLAAGFDDVVAAVSSQIPATLAYVRGPGLALAERFGAKLRWHEESVPLGNIGAAGSLGAGITELLVVFADNLTSLDLNALVAHHRRTGAAMTSAVHAEPFRMPYGEVRLHDGDIIAYDEKPELKILISSGLFVLSRRALDEIPPRRTEVSWLVNALLARGDKVAAYVHDAPWIDVNDLPAADRAERLFSGDAGTSVRHGMSTGPHALESEAGAT